jgi:hypothetical protein
VIISLQLFGDSMLTISSARLTARGHQQVQVSTIKRFLHVISKSSFRLVTTMAKILQKPFHTVDITTTFLHTKLQRPAYVHIP